MIKSAAFKLTLWYLGIIMVLSSLFSVALYRESYNQMAENVDHQRMQIKRLPLPDVLEQRRSEFLGILDDQLDDDRRRLQLRLIILNLGTILIGGGAAYLLARRTLRPIQESMEAQGRFTADASHELRTPLTAMRTEIEVALRDKSLDANEARELLASNLEEIAKLEALSAGLLRLARSGDRLDAAAVTIVSAKDIIGEAVKRFEAAADAKKVKIEVKVGDETVEGDRESLMELVAILTDNAIKYGPKSGTVIITSLAAGGNWRLTVADEGEGIDPTDLPHIFDRFYRADRSRTKSGQITGYGLGLSIAKRIANLHRGAIAVDSQLGKGTIFKVKIPTAYAPRPKLF